MRTTMTSRTAPSCASIALPHEKGDTVDRVDRHRTARVEGARLAPGGCGPPHFVSDFHLARLVLTDPHSHDRPPSDEGVDVAPHVPEVHARAQPTASGR